MTTTEDKYKLLQFPTDRWSVLLESAMKSSKLHAILWCSDEEWLYATRLLKITDPMTSVHLDCMEDSTSRTIGRTPSNQHLRIKHTGSYTMTLSNDVKWA